MHDIWIIYSTFPHKKEALSAARRLLAQKLIACANIHDGVTSLYHWQGELHEEPEATLIAKTHHNRLEEAMNMLKQWHPNELPCIAAYPIAAGLPEFLQWVAGEVVPA